MKTGSRMLVCVSVLWMACGACLLSTSSLTVSAGPLLEAVGTGPQERFTNAVPRSDHDKALLFYTQGRREVGKAQQEDIDAAQAGRDEKKAAKAIEKAQKDYASALHQFQSAIGKDATLIQVWNAFGFCQQHLGNYQDALAAYGKALELNPTYAEAYEHRAETYLGLNMLDEAKQSYAVLFKSVRPLADDLMTSMHHWIDEHQKNANGIKPDDLAAFAKWVDESAKTAQQTAS